MNDKYDDIWEVYYHDPYNEDWSIDSYKKICQVNSIKEYCILNSVVKDKFIKGMFFVMRNNIFPDWNNEQNRKGGVLSLKITKENTQDAWNILLLRLFEGILLDKNYITKVNGLSMSPKRQYCIIKIWLSTNCEYCINPNNYYLVDIPFHGNIIHKTHV